MRVRSIFFLQFVEKMEKLKLSLSTEHNKMLKIKTEMLKISKYVEARPLGEISCENFSGNFINPEIVENFLKTVPFPG